MSKTTPVDLSIKPRDYHFGSEVSGMTRWWKGGDPVATAFFNALSSTFPLGERFFMDAVRHYRGEATGVLKEQVAAFLTQEAIHSREHVVFNRMAEASGYAMDPLEARTAATLAYARTRPKIEQLAATCALEHYTAILAHALLSDPSYLDGAPDEAKRLWCWHAMEEIEHKAVAYDTFLMATKDWSGLRRWSMRSSAMIFATIRFFATITGNLADLYAQDGIRNAKTWRATAWYMFANPGILRRVLGDYLAYYRPGFHPWDVDDRNLLAKAERLIAVPSLQAVAV